VELAPPGPDFLGMDLATKIDTLIGPNSSDIAWWQMSIRALIVLCYGLLFVRIAGQRTFGKMSAFDIVIAIIVGSNLSRAMTGNAPLWASLIATTLLGALHYLLGRLSIHNRWLGAFIKGEPRQIIRDGKVDEAAMRKAELSTGDLEEALRQHGLQTADSVGAAYLERNGAISVIKRD
jgi:uncharacterized membrane protein YcaP (DUF421 family)